MSKGATIIGPFKYCPPCDVWFRYGITVAARLIHCPRCDGKLVARTGREWSTATRIVENPSATDARCALHLIGHRDRYKAVVKFQ